ncbi:protease inhibitor I42 family protein [Novispirillum sp. DQ9]|uniref:protease inhibitor I42 family protein n=1 Tax=Novispirillum sp. DQ9 TaxID=3398612 RepID=UPI003C7A79BF
MRTVLSACALGLALLAAAVAGGPADAQTPPAPPPSGGGGAPVVLPGGPMERMERTAAVGEAVDIRLAGNATTGYLWAIDTAASQGLDRLTAAGDSYHTAAQEAPAPGADDVPIAGAPGTQVFHFVAAAPGEARVVFIYRRPWVPTAIEKTAEAVITVK